MELGITKKKTFETNINTTLIEFELTQEEIFSTYESSMGNTAPSFRDALRIEQISSIDYFVKPGSR